MRVISGTARGTVLATLPGEDTTRPTIDRVKEAMFSALQFTLPGARVLDLYAGSGQLGIEALSRGAEACVFCDHTPAATAVVKDNLHRCGLFEKAKVLTIEAEAYLSQTKDLFDVILLDPPYHMGRLEKILPRIAAITAPGGMVVCESEAGLTLPPSCDGLTYIKGHKYGKVQVHRYQKQWEA